MGQTRHAAILYVETHLALLDSRVLKRWHRSCPLLADSAITTPSELPAWLWSLPNRQHQDDVLRALVSCAQQGDPGAALAVVACLKRGLYSLARRSPLPLDDLVAQATLRVLDLPLATRRNIAGGLLLDVRRYMWAECQEQAKTLPMAPSALSHLVDTTAADADNIDTSAGEQLLDLVADAHRQQHLSDDDARLIVETRLGGTDIHAAAQQRSINRKALYKRRDRAERALASSARGELEHAA